MGLGTDPVKTSFRHRLKIGDHGTVVTRDGVTIFDSGRSPVCLKRGIDFKVAEKEGKRISIRKFRYKIHLFRKNFLQNIPAGETFSVPIKVGPG
jgi:hypothetical protein